MPVAKGVLVKVCFRMLMPPLHLEVAPLLAVVRWIGLAETDPDATDHAVFVTFY
jgi:hypothetical protein